MSTVTITGTVTDSAGGSGNYLVTITLDAVTATATVSPDPAPTGTLRVLTILATSSAGLPLTFATPVSPGVVFTVVPGSPNKFTFTV
jgi:hypothetical protein